MKTNSESVKVLKAAMALKHLKDSELFSSMGIVASTEHQDTVKKVEDMTKLFIEHDVKTLFDMIDTEDELREVMALIEMGTFNDSDSEPSEKEDDEDNCDCDLCSGTSEQEDEEPADAEDDFNMHVAETLIMLIDAQDVSLAQIKKLQNNNRELKKAVEHIVGFLEKQFGGKE